MKVAINGFGRIGRLVLRALYESKKKYNFDIVAINDIQEIDTAIHLLKYDSVHGPFRDKVQKISEKEFRINQSRIIYVSEKFPERLPWKDLGVDLVMECTGMFKIRDLYGRHIKAGAKKVLLSFPADDSDKTVVYGVNHYSIDNEKDIFVSNASCTTNCLAHLIKILHWKVGIQNGFMTTIHSYTGDQRLIDTNHSDLRRSRAAAMCMVPTSSGATNTIGKIFPELEGKLSGLSIRVPTPNVSIVDFTFTAAKKITVKGLCKLFIDNADSELGYSDEPLVSVDFNHSDYSSIVDLPLIQVIDEKIGHIIAWYDNEWGFSNRMLDVAQTMLRCFNL